MSAELLRRAADLIVKRAAAATAGPWGTALDVGGHTATVRRRDGNDVSLVAWLPTWKWTSDSWEHPAFSNADWIATLGPQVAAPLAAWLRESATELELRQVRVAGLNIPEQDAWAEQAFRQSLDFARVILGEDAS